MFPVRQLETVAAAAELGFDRRLAPGDGCGFTLGGDGSGVDGIFVLRRRWRFAIFGDAFCFHIASLLTTFSLITTLY